MVIFRKTVITDSFGCFRIKCTCKLCIPVKDTAGICHLVIDISCMRDSFGNICRMGCNLGSNNSLFDIFYIRKSQMFCRCYIAEECGSVHGCNSTTDRSSDMVISRCDIGNERSKYIEWRSHADGLLNFHVGSNLVKRHMARSFNHDLHVMGPCTFGKFSKTYQLFNLAYISGISQTARTTCISKRNSNVMLFTDVQNLIEVFIERIFFTGHAHPCKYKASTTAYNVHFTFVFFDLLDGLSCDSAVESNKINTVLSMKANYVDEIMGSQFREIALIMNDTVVYRNGSDHCRTLMCQFLAERLCIAVAGEIHDRFCTEIYCFHNFLHFDIIIFAVSGYTKVYIDLGAQHAADTFRVQAGMMFVGTDRYFTFGNQFHHFFNRHVFFFCNSFDLRGYDAFACGIHLCCISCHMVYSPSM